MCFQAISRLGLAFLFCFAGETWAEGFTLAAEEQPNLLQVKIYKLIVDPSSMQPVVLLADSLEERAMVIWIGPCEATAIQGEIQGVKQPRPSTHDLVERIIRKTGGTLERIIITHSKDNTYYATIVLGKDHSPLEIDARPSDSLALALKFKAPIYVAKKLFEEMAVPLKEPKAADEIYGLTTQELTFELAQSFSFGSTQGVLVSDVREGSQAEKDGLQRGDIFVELGKKTLESVKSLKEVLGQSKGPVKAKVFRKGAFQSLNLHP